MRILIDIAMFVIGLIAALATVSLTRHGFGAWSLVQISLLVLVLAVFYLKEKKLAALVVGLGLGLDTLSAYPFLVWTLIISGTTIVGWWMSKNVLTNRSLPSLILLGVVMRAAYFLLELGVSRAGGIFGGSVWYKITGTDLLSTIEAFGIEILALAILFMIHVRLHGERARMLTHV